MDVSDFDFALPPELIAQEPPPERAGGRLLHVSRATGALVHSGVADIAHWLTAGDILVVNNTRVFPARLLGTRLPSGGAVECLLVERVPDEANGPGETWEALMHPGQKLKPGSQVYFEREGQSIRGEVLERRFFGRRLIRLWTENGGALDRAVDALGHMPLPPYIRRPDRHEDRQRYQTVFAAVRGSIAAPTAGLHLSTTLLDRLRAIGVEVVEITLHVGYGTFQPVRVEVVEEHRLHSERYAVSVAAAATMNAAIDEGRRIIAVGTTTTRTLEAVARAHDGRIAEGSGSTDLFIYPGYEFRVVSGLLTNFHLPRSSLLMLVCAFAGRQSVLHAYQEAIAARYRFYSYGDAMLIT